MANMSPSTDFERLIKENLHAEPCIRCNDPDHRLSYCTDTQARSGSVWKCLTDNEVVLANRYLTALELKYLHMRKGSPETDVASHNGWSTETMDDENNTVEEDKTSSISTAVTDNQKNTLSRKFIDKSSGYPPTNDSDSIQGSVQTSPTPIKIADAFALEPQTVPSATTYAPVILSPDPESIGARTPEKQTEGPSARQAITNRFEIQFKSDTRFFLYRFAGLPGRKSKSHHKSIIKSAIRAWPFLRDNREHFITYDTSMVIAWKPLHDNPPDKDIVQGDIVGVTDPPILDAEKLSLRYSDELDLEALRCCFQNQTTTYDLDLPTWDSTPVIKALKLILSKSLTQDAIQVSGNIFFYKFWFEGLSEALLINRGYRYTVTPGREKLLLNIHAATSAIYRPIRLNELLADRELFNTKNSEDMLRGLRVYVHRDRSEDPADQSRIDKLNMPTMRTFTIKSLGGPIKDQLFQKRPRDEKEEPQGTLVMDHLKKGKPFQTPRAFLTNYARIW
jgi:hypothetical protein